MRQVTREGSPNLDVCAVEGGAGTEKRGKYHEGVSTNDINVCLVVCETLVV